MVESVRGAVAALSVVALSALPILTPTTTVRPTRTTCDWLPALLPLPANTSEGRVTAGAGTWLAGVADGPEDDDPDQGVLWRNGRAKALGHAFGLDTTLHGVNPSGVAVGSVVGTDQRPHAIRHRDGQYEYLPETAGSSVALDINTRGEITGYDGTTLVVWPPTGPARALTPPPDATPFGTPAIDENGTVVARAGHLDSGTLTWQGQAWSPDGTRTPFPPGAQPSAVTDVRNGQVVGASTQAPDTTTATSWLLESPSVGGPSGDLGTGGADEGPDGDRNHRLNGHGERAAGGRLDEGSEAKSATGLESRGERSARVFLGGASAVAVNHAGVVVGVDVAGEPLLWDGLVPVELVAPAGFHSGSVAALNDHEAGGFVSPEADFGTVPVRWRCR